jgi:hypothetical protein
MTRRHRRHPFALLAAVLGVALIGSTACGITFSHQAEARDEITRSYPIAQGGTFEVRNTNGTIGVEPFDGETIEVVAERVVRASTDEAAEEALADFEIRETVSDDHVLLDSSRQGMGLQLNLSYVVNYTVRLPQWANVTLASTNGAVDVAGVSGEVRIAATNGRIRGSALRNGAVVEATNGKVTLDFAEVGEQGIRCETTNGAITVTVPRDSDATLSARVTNGSIDTNDLDLEVSEDSRRRLEGSIGDGGPAIALRTRNGMIRVNGR